MQTLLLGNALREGQNDIRRIPSHIRNLAQLTTLDVSALPVDEPPLEVVKRGPEAIRGYFDQLERMGTDYLYEAINR